MLKNAYLVAKIGADTAENEQHFAEILPTDALWLAPRASEPADPAAVDFAHRVLVQRERSAIIKLKIKKSCFEN